jgi:hypothetical protein
MSFYVKKGRLYLRSPRRIVSKPSRNNPTRRMFNYLTR